MVGNISQQCLNFLAGWGEMEGLAVCWHGGGRCAVSGVLIAREGEPALPGKNLRIGAVSTHAFAVCSFRINGMMTSGQGSSSSRKLPVDADVCWGAWAHRCSETCRSSERCSAAFSHSSPHVCRLPRCRQKSLINCHCRT